MDVSQIQKQVEELQRQLLTTNQQLTAIHSALEQQAQSRPVTAYSDNGRDPLGYSDLVHRYGHHLNRGVDGLLALWRQMGGEHGWQNYCLTPDQLTLLLSEDETPVIHLRVNREHNVTTHGTFVELADIRPFFCQILSRLPNLKRVMITDCPVSPFDWPSMATILNPFPQLRFLMLWSTVCSTSELIELTRRVPSLIPLQSDENGSVRVNRAFLTDPAEEATMSQASDKIRVYS